MNEHCAKMEKGTILFEDLFYSNIKAIPMLCLRLPVNKFLFTKRDAIFCCIFKEEGYKN